MFIKVALITLILSGCTALNRSEIEDAIEFCKGLDNVYSLSYGGSAYTIRCNDYSTKLSDRLTE